MGTATLKTTKESLQAAPEDSIIERESFSFLHTDPEDLDLAIVFDKETGKLYAVRAGEAGEIPEIGTVTHEE